MFPIGQVRTETVFTRQARHPAMFACHIFMNLDRFLSIHIINSICFVRLLSTRFHAINNGILHTRSLVSTQHRFPLILLSCLEPFAARSILNYDFCNYSVNLYLKQINVFIFNQNVNFCCLCCCCC